MMEPNSLASIDNETVDEVVIGALAMLIEDDTCAVSFVSPSDAEDITVAVYCDDDQQSAVVLRCSQALARNLTGKMLELEPDEIVDADILDATGELVNVIAGNLRGLVSSPGTMTAPFALDHEAYRRFFSAAVNTYSVTDEALQVLRM